MARDGFLHRISRALGIGRKSPPPPPPPPPSPPPSPPPHPRPESPYREIWRQNREPRTGSYGKHLAVFHSMIDPIEDDPDLRLELWESYVQNMVNRSPERRQSTDNLFWRDTGIDPKDFDWAKWRIAMGYTGTHRSRTP